MPTALRQRATTASRPPCSIAKESPSAASASTCAQPDATPHPSATPLAGRRALVTGGLIHDGITVDPGAIRNCALLTIEGTEDRIIAPGQTAAAHALCPRLPPERHLALRIEGCNHLALFGGEAFQAGVVPAIIAWLERWLG